MTDLLSHLGSYPPDCALCGQELYDDAPHDHPHPYPRGTRVRFGNRTGTILRADRKRREDVYLVLPEVRDNGDGVGGQYVPWRSVTVVPS